MYTYAEESPSCCYLTLCQTVTFGALALLRSMSEVNLAGNKLHCHQVGSRFMASQHKELLHHLPNKIRNMFFKNNLETVQLSDYVNKMLHSKGIWHHTLTALGPRHATTPSSPWIWDHPSSWPTSSFAKGMGGYFMSFSEGIGMKRAKKNKHKHQTRPFWCTSKWKHSTKITFTRTTMRSMCVKVPLRSGLENYMFLAGWWIPRATTIQAMHKSIAHQQITFYKMECSTYTANTVKCCVFF